VILVMTEKVQPDMEIKEDIELEELEDIDFLLEDIEDKIAPLA
jgi:hypothetical protein